MARPTVLCIDDEEVGLEVRKMLLERSGYRVLTASTGSKGLVLFDSQPVDAVVLDYAMPGMDGGQVAAEMRKRNRSVRILMLSAYLTLPEKVLKLADASATKGDGVAALLDTLKRLLG